MASNLTTSGPSVTSENVAETTTPRHASSVTTDWLDLLMLGIGTFNWDDATTVIKTTSSTSSSDLLTSIELDATSTIHHESSISEETTTAKLTNDSLSNNNVSFITNDDGPGKFNDIIFWQRISSTV